MGQVLIWPYSNPEFNSDKGMNHSPRIVYPEELNDLTANRDTAPGILYQIEPLFTLDTKSLFDVSDPAAYFSSSTEFNIVDHIFVSAAACTSAGNLYQHYKIYPESGSYKDIYDFFLKIYF